MLNIVLVDHNDSFTHNVVDWLLVVPQIENIRIVNFEDEKAMNSLVDEAGLDLLILSPGPHAPQDARPTLKLTKKIMFKVPLLGICLGHQIIGFHLGFKVEPLKEPMHGKKRRVIINDFLGLYQDIAADSLEVGVYNSLSLSGDAKPLLSPDWVISGHDEKGQILSLEYRHPQLAPVMAMQFHPDSFLTSQKDVIARNIYRIVETWVKGLR